MKNEDEEVTGMENFEGRVFNSEIDNFNSLINIILDYYSFTQTEEGEEWKKGTNHENKVVPDDLDELIKKAFKSQINKFID